jgi:hypothetical protein
MPRRVTGARGPHERLFHVFAGTGLRLYAGAPVLAGAARRADLRVAGPVEVLPDGRVFEVAGGRRVPLSEGRLVADAAGRLYVARVSPLSPPPPGLVPPPRGDQPMPPERPIGPRPDMPLPDDVPRRKRRP